jgi:hypothetical protein
MNRLDVLVDRAANGLQKLADQAAGGNGMKAKLAEELADDAAFLRKLKPSLMVARAKGEAPTNQKPGQGTVVPRRPRRRSSGRARNAGAAARTRSSSLARPSWPASSSPR